MPLLPIHCTHCNKLFFRNQGRINESRKLNWKAFCSPSCLRNYRKNGTILTCENLNCQNKFYRVPKAISPHNFCSRSCAVSVNNSKFPKNPGVRKVCASCGKEFISRRKYCSVKCHTKGQIIGKEELIKRIRKFYKKNSRIPVKSEFRHYSAVRYTFGTWNNAIEAAGFSPNPVMFAKKHIANDGHKCDSLAEKIIDDWLHARGIVHERRTPYPGSLGFTADFVVGDYWVEFFGLHGQHKRYDELRKKKLRLTKTYGLKLIELYPGHLFPKNQLDNLLAGLVK